jgi:hypothetical protein
MKKLLIASALLAPIAFATPSFAQNNGGNNGDTSGATATATGYQSADGSFAVYQDLEATAVAIGRNTNAYVDGLQSADDAAFVKQKAELKAIAIAEKKKDRNNHRRDR